MAYQELIEQLHIEELSFLFSISVFTLEKSILEPVCCFQDGILDKLYAGISYSRSSTSKVIITFLSFHLYLPSGESNTIFLSSTCEKQNFCYITCSTMHSKYAVRELETSAIAVPHKLFFLFHCNNYFLIMIGYHCQMCHRIYYMSDILWKTNFTHTTGCFILM